MGYPRHITVPPDTPGLYHCTSRCVRRAFLCGEDPLTGRSFEHRRQWVEDRILELAQLFAVAIHSYCVMDNHFHVVIETDPTVALAWSDIEVARRWSHLTNPAKESDELQPSRLDALLAQPERLLELRSRLGSLSWFMRCLKEPIARRANKEDGCTGHFWEGRFVAQALLDDRALLGAMVYVDLNPIRAKIATSPEDSKHTSIKRRIENLAEHHDNQLQPLASSIVAHDMPTTSEEYLQLVDWSGRVLHPGKRGSIDDRVPEVLQRLQLRKTQWLTQVPATESHFWRVIGSAESIIELAKSSGRKWFRGIGMARYLEHIVDTR